MRHLHLGKLGWGVLLLVVLVLSHGMVFYHIASKFKWPALLGLFLVVLLKHFGVVQSLYVLWKRRSSSAK